MFYLNKESLQTLFLEILTGLFNDLAFKKPNIVFQKTTQLETKNFLTSIQSFSETPKFTTEYGIQLCQITLENYKLFNKIHKLVIPEVALYCFVQIFITQQKPLFEATFLNFYKNYLCN